jgi:hypothetical protein
MPSSEPYRITLRNDKISCEQAPHFMAQFCLSENVIHPVKAEFLLRTEAPGCCRNYYCYIKLSQSETLKSRNCRHSLTTNLRKWSVLPYRSTRGVIKSFPLWGGIKDNKSNMPRDSLMCSYTSRLQHSTCCYSSFYYCFLKDERHFYFIFFLYCFSRMLS